MARDNIITRSLNIQIPRDLYVFLKQEATREDLTLKDFVTPCLKAFKKRYELKRAKQDELQAQK